MQWVYDLLSSVIWGTSRPTSLLSTGDGGLRDRSIELDRADLLQRITTPGHQPNLQMEKTFGYDHFGYLTGYSTTVHPNLVMPRPMVQSFGEYMLMLHFSFPAAKLLNDYRMNDLYKELTNGIAEIASKGVCSEDDVDVILIWPRVDPGEDMTRGILFVRYYEQIDINRWITMKASDFANMYQNELFDPKNCKAVDIAQTFIAALEIAMHLDGLHDTCDFYHIPTHYASREHGAVQLNYRVLPPAALDRLVRAKLPRYPFFFDQKLREATFIGTTMRQPVLLSYPSEVGKFGYENTDLNLTPAKSIPWPMGRMKYVAHSQMSKPNVSHISTVASFFAIEDICNRENLEWVSVDLTSKAGERILQLYAELIVDPEARKRLLVDSGMSWAEWVKPPVTGDTNEVQIRTKALVALAQYGKNK